jgi:desulfoferrodoxin (superoxide reductase-like protein)
MGRLERVREGQKSHLLQWIKVQREDEEVGRKKLTH